MTKPKLNIYWSRRDFRITDNPALFASCQDSLELGIDFLPIFFINKLISTTSSQSTSSYPAKLFLSKSLAHFAYKFSNLIIGLDDPVDCFRILSEQFEVCIFANEDIDPESREEYNRIIEIGIKLRLFVDQINVDKDTLSGTGNLYSVFSPFKKNVWTKLFGKKPTQSPLSIPSTIKKISNFGIESLEYANSTKQLQEKIFETIDSTWQVRFGNTTVNLDNIFDRPSLDMWNYTEEDVMSDFERYLESDNLLKYNEYRDNLGLDKESSGLTSRMSVALRFGLISPRQIVFLILQKYGESYLEFDNPTNDPNIITYLSELVWREFYKYILFHKPSVMELEFQVKYQSKIHWLDQDRSLYFVDKWVQSQTGYAIVDAAMKQIAKTGWMHNRSRMVVASILTKNFGVDWRWGQEYFRAMLLDLDEAANNGGWQWSASVGSDPKPIRIFNPYLQSQKYDKQSTYQKLWLTNDYNYLQEPIIEHKDARELAKKRYGLA